MKNFLPVSFFLSFFFVPFFFFLYAYVGRRSRRPNPTALLCPTAPDPPDLTSPASPSLPLLLRLPFLLPSLPLHIGCAHNHRQHTPPLTRAAAGSTEPTLPRSASTQPRWAQPSNRHHLAFPSSLPPKTAHIPTRPSIQPTDPPRRNLSDLCQRRNRNHQAVPAILGSPHLSRAFPALLPIHRFCWSLSRVPPFTHAKCSINPPVCILVSVKEILLWMYILGSASKSNVSRSIHVFILNLERQVLLFNYPSSVGHISKFFVSGRWTVGWMHRIPHRSAPCRGVTMGVIAKLMSFEGFELDSYSIRAE